MVPSKVFRGYSWLAGLLLILSPGGSCEPRRADMNDDGRVDPVDAYYLQHQWQMNEKGADLTGDGYVGEEDVLEFKAQWHATMTPENPYTVGRAVGIHFVAESSGEVFTSPEMEIEIASSTSEFKPTLMTRSSNLQEEGQSSPELSVVAGPEMPGLIESMLCELQPCGVSRRELVADGTPEFGVAYDKIGTFWGESIWIGWGANFSETYSPNGESYSWVVYFAPEAVYVALQKAEYVYSSVDVNAGVGVFWGVINSPGGEYLMRSYVDSLCGITFSRSLSTNLITGLPGLAPVPAFALSTDVTFFRVNGIDVLNRAIQFGSSVSVSFDLLPAGSFALPFSVSLETSSEVTAGFNPIIIWNLDPNAGGNPIDEIKKGLNRLFGAEVDPAGAIYSILSQRFAGRLIPFMEHLQAPVPVTLENGVRAPSNAAYFTHFLQTASTQRPASSPDTSIDHLIGRVEAWLQTGNTSELPEAINKGFDFNEDLLVEEEKNLQAATHLGFQIGYNRGCDANPDCKKVYAECIKKVYCPPGEWCSIVVEATEASDLFPGSTPEDFEEVWVRIDRDPMDYFNGGDTYAWVQFDGGLAIHEFVMASNTPIVLRVFIHRDYNPIDSTRHIELCPREVIPAARATLRSNTKALEGSSVPLQCVVTDEDGVPVAEPALVKFYDYRGYLIGAPVETEDGIAAIQFVPKPSIPRIDSFTTTLVGYSEEEARTGYSLKGIGFSVDADVEIGGESVSNRTGWEWQFMSSSEILFLPPDDSALLTEETMVQVVNPGDIRSNEYLYQP